MRACGALIEPPTIDTVVPPPIVYHGTDAAFDDFELTYDIGFHFGSRETAEARLLTIGGGEFPEGSNVRPVVPVVRSALRLPDLLDWSPRAVVAALLNLGVIDEEDGEVEIVDGDQVEAWLNRAGFDSIVYGNKTEGGGDSWIVFRADQVLPLWSDGAKRRLRHWMR